MSWLLSKLHINRDDITYGLNIVLNWLTLLLETPNWCLELGGVDGLTALSFNISHIYNEDDQCIDRIVDSGMQITNKLWWDTISFS